MRASSWIGAAACIVLSLDGCTKPVVNPEQPAAPQYGAFHALVIGNSAYAHLPRLDTPHNDVKDLAKLLRQRYAFAVRPLLLDASRQQVIAALHSLRDLREGHSLLIYYAGHGQIDEATREGYWQMVDSTEGDRSTWVSNADVANELRAIRAKHVLVIADSCYSGTLVNGTRGTASRYSHDQLQRLAERRARVVISSGNLEQVSDGGGGRNSLFAARLLHQLRENDDVMPSAMLYAKLAQDLHGQDQTPQYGRAVGEHDADGDFLLVPTGLAQDTLAPVLFGEVSLPSESSEDREDLALIRSLLDVEDYRGAWAAVSRESALSPRDPSLQRVEVEVAQSWLRNARTSDGETFASLVEPLLPTLQRAAATQGNKKAAATALAHIGWAHFLRHREGHRGVDVEELYRKARALDPENVYANAMWAHWLIAGDTVQGGKAPFELAKERFANALAHAQGSDRVYVRTMQLGAWEWRSEVSHAVELLRVASDMREANETLEPALREDILWGVYVRSGLAKEIDKVFDPPKHLATFKWLVQGLEMSSKQMFILARLVEIVEGCEAALPHYELVPDSLLRDDLARALQRCRGRSEPTRVEGGVRAKRAQEGGGGDHRPIEHEVSE